MKPSDWALLLLWTVQVNYLTQNYVAIACFTIYLLINLLSALVGMKYIQPDIVIIVYGICIISYLILTTNSIIQFASNPTDY